MNSNKWQVLNFHDFINESYLEESHAPLYHTTSVYNAYEIIKDNALNPFIEIISFSRNKDFIYDNGSITFICNQSKLKNNFKIVPFRYGQGTNLENEFEEQIEKPIFKLNNYLISIRLNNSINKFKNSEYGSKYEKREAYEDLIPLLHNYSIKYNIPIIDQKERVVDLKPELEKVLTEGIYNKDLFGIRLRSDKFMDEDFYRVQYSSYTPIMGTGEENKFIKFLKKNNINYSQFGSHIVKLDSKNYFKMKDNINGTK